MKITKREAMVPFALNVPDLRLKIGLDYVPEEGFSANLSGRYHSEFESVNSAAWTGANDSSFLIDVGIDYNFNKYKFLMSASNLLVQEYQPIANAPLVKRTFMFTVVAGLF